jgi:hypothetical protein
MLALSLQALESLKPAEVNVNIYADDGANLDEVTFVRDSYCPSATIHAVPPHIYAPSGTYNILHSIKSGYETGAEFVYFIEEDVLVKPGYFDWHQQQMATGKYVATCGRKDARYYAKHVDIYTNPGSCLRRDLIANLIPHINDDYMTRLRDYLNEKLGPPWPEVSDLDDGLIRHVIRSMNGVCKYSDIPTVRHIGFHAYNRLAGYTNREGSIESRIERLRQMLAEIQPGGRYTSDLEF